MSAPNKLRRFADYLKTRIEVMQPGDAFTAQDLRQAALFAPRGARPWKVDGLPAALATVDRWIRRALDLLREDGYLETCTRLGRAGYAWKIAQRTTKI